MKKLSALFLLVSILFFGKTTIRAQAPTISSFTPASGAPGTLFTITGTNLSSPTAFKIGGVSASAIVVSNTGTSLVGMVMPGAATGTVAVTTSGGTATSSGTFTIQNTSYPIIQQGNKLVGTSALVTPGQGWAVTLSADGTTALVGGYYDNNGVGASWVYTRSGNSWTQQAKLIGTGAATNAWQGFSVALSADGNTAIVGGVIDNSAWVFTRSGTTWSQQGTKLVGSDRVGNAWFGKSVSLSADGNTAIVGGYQDNTNIGAAWVFTRSGTTWTQQGTKLVGTGAVGIAGQGHTVSLSADGSIVAIGGATDDTNKGATWIFTRSGTTWTQQGNKLLGNDAVGAAKQGQSVSLSADATTLIIGGINATSNVSNAWVFTRSGTTWTQQGSKLAGSDAVGTAANGTSVTLTADGSTAMMGSVSDNNNTGAAWVFTRSGSTWTQQRNKLLGTGATGTTLYEGRSVAISANGTNALVGADGDATNLGAVWSYSTGVTYDGNGNTGGTVPASQLATIGSSVTLATNTGTLMKTGYTFAGWNTLANGTETSYASGASYTFTGSVTLYAKWTANNYTVTFDANGGTGTMSNQSIAYLASSNLTSNVFTRTGYTFAGWATTSGGTVAYANGDSYTMSSAANVTLYAKWTLNNYTVTFDANGGTGTMSNQSIAYLDSANLTSNTFTRTGYTFAGWATTSGGTVAYANGAIYTMSTAANVTLYAQWIIIIGNQVSSQISYTGRIENLVVPAGVTSINIETWGAQGGGSPTVYGCNCSLAGGKGAYMKGTFSVTPGETLKVLVGQMGGSSGGAHGNENGGGGGTFVVRQTGNIPLVISGGGGGASTAYGTSCSRSSSEADGQITTSGATIGCVQTAAGGASGNGGNTAGTYEGGAGGGFFTNGANGGTHCSLAYGGSSFLNGGAGGTGNTCYSTLNYGGFGGGGGGMLGGPGGGGGYSGGAAAGQWSSYSTYGGGGGGSYNIGTNPVNLAGVNTGNGKVIITFNVITVTFDANGGTGTMSNQFITYLDSTNLTSNAFTRKGYTFAGWATTTGGTVSYTNGASYTMSVAANVTLYAKWNCITTVSTTNISVCANIPTYTWNGIVRAAPGTYIYNTTNSIGCDSLATLNLAVLQTTNFIETIISPGAYTWHGNTYTSSTITPTWIGVNAVGCDSVVTLHLTITCTPTSSTETVSACESYLWNSITYTTSGIKTFTTTNAGGCDSTATLNLTINTLVYDTTRAVFCESGIYIWPINGADYVSAGTYSYTSNCVTYILILRNVQASSSTTNYTACSSSMPYYWNGIARTSAGTYTYTTPNANGCDSVATLVLTVSTVTPSAPTSVIQTLVSNICGARVYRYSVTAITNAVGYAWTLPSSVGGVSGVTVDSGDVTRDRVIKLKYASNAAAIAGDSIKVRSWSGCGNSAIKVVKLSNAALAVPAAPTALTITAVAPSVCGAKVYRYAAPIITSALAAGTATVAPVTGYQWSFTGLGTTARIDSGDVNSQVIRVNYTSNAAATIGDSVRVSYTSLCGNGLNKSAKLTNIATAVPAAPSAIAITAVAPSVCGAKEYRYAAPIITSVLAAGTATVAPVTGYQWSFTGLGTTARIDSGDVNSQVIKVSYTSNAAATIGDSVRVSYTSLCGNGLNKSAKLTNVTTTATLVPASITITPVTTTICGNRVYRYSAPNLPVATTTAAATGYVWSFEGTLGDNAHIDSGDVNSQKIVVSYTLNSAATTEDSVKLYYTSSCGNSLAKGAKLTNKLLTAPLAPASINITLVKDSCGARVYRYAAPVLPIATTTAMAANGYEWSLPTGSAVGLSASLDSGVLSGAEARYIRLKFTNNAAAGANDSIRVRYTSGCGISANKAQKLSNVTATTLAASSTLTGTTSICSIVGTSTSARYTTSAVTGAVSYLWTLPSGAVLDSGSNGLKIKVRYITAGPNDSIYVQAVGTNGCAGAKKVLNLVTTGCVTLPTTRVINPVITSTEETMNVMVYPNPTTSAYQLFVKSSKLSQTVKARIVDLQGRLIKTLSFNSNETIAFGNELKAGVYMVEVREGDKVKTVKVVKY